MHRITPRYIIDNAELIGNNIKWTDSATTKQRWKYDSTNWDIATGIIITCSSIPSKYRITRLIPLLLIIDKYPTISTWK